LYTNKWEDQRGRVWELYELSQPHLENIQKLLKDVLDGRRETPENCDQSKLELRASLLRINSEVARRKLSTSTIEKAVTYTVSINPGVSVQQIIETLQQLPPASRYALTSPQIKITFKG